MALQDATALQERIDDLSDEGLEHALGWLVLSSGGDADAHRERVSGFIAGPVRRHRAGWLLLALDCVNDACATNEVDFLFDLRERLDSSGLLPSCMPF